MKSRKNPIIRSIKVLVSVLFLSILSNGCADADKADNFANASTLNSYIFNEEIKLIRSQILESSHLNMLIKEQGVPFDITLLNFPGNAKNYMNSQEMATNIGVFVSDLNYLFAYEKDESRKTYLDAIYYLAEQLDVDNAFDKNKFDVLLSDVFLDREEKIQFLENLVKEAEEKINTDARAQLVALIVSGSWTEGMFINFSLAVKSWPNEVIANEMWVHLESYERIMKILDYFKDYQPCADRLAELETIRPEVELVLRGDVLEIKENLEDIYKKVATLRMGFINI